MDLVAAPRARHRTAPRTRSCVDMHACVPNHTSLEPMLAGQVHPVAVAVSRRQRLLLVRVVDAAKGRESLMVVG